MRGRNFPSEDNVQKKKDHTHSTTETRYDSRE